VSIFPPEELALDGEQRNQKGHERCGSQVVDRNQAVPDGRYHMHAAATVHFAPERDWNASEMHRD
jgi:hypothetical protein